MEIVPHLHCWRFYACSAAVNPTHFTEPTSTGHVVISHLSDEGSVSYHRADLIRAHDQAFNYFRLVS